MKGLVLAAGLGRRLQPLTSWIPKPLVPVMGRPCIEYLLDWLAAEGLDEVAINTHHLPEPLRATLGDGSRWGLRLHWQHEKTLLEGIGTVKSFDHFLGDEPVVCVNGDIVTDLTFDPVLATHHQRKAALTLVVAPLVGPPLHPVVWSADGLLTGIRRTRLDAPDGRYVGVFTGVMVIEPLVWREFVEPGERCHLAIDLCPRLLAAGVRVACHLSGGLWADIGSRDSLDLAHARILDHRTRRYLDHVAEVQPGVFAAPDAEVLGELTAPVFLGERSRVEPGARLGPYAALDTGAVLASGEELAYGVRLGG